MELATSIVGKCGGQIEVLYDIHYGPTVVTFCARGHVIVNPTTPLFYKAAKLTLPRTAPLELRISTANRRIC